MGRRISNESRLDSGSAQVSDLDQTTCGLTAVTPVRRQRQRRHPFGVCFDEGIDDTALDEDLGRDRSGALGR
jgi:hypothetical protein